MCIYNSSNKCILIKLYLHFSLNLLFVFYGRLSDLAELKQKTMLTLSTITLYNGHVLNQLKFILWFVKLFLQ